MSSIWTRIASVFVGGQKQIVLSGDEAGSPFADLLGQFRKPTDSRLLAAYRETVYACAAYNAQACAGVPIKLYVKTGPGQKTPRLPVRDVTKAQRGWVSKNTPLAPMDRLDEVVEHPLLDLLREANDELDQFSLLELTDLHQELVGVAYWWIEADGSLGIPNALWPLPPQHIEPIYNAAKTKVIAYKYHATGGQADKVYAAEDIVVFRFLNPANPYGSYWSPTRAAWESIQLMARDRSFAAQGMDNQNVPPAFIAPEERIGDMEARRLERRWERKFRWGSGGAIVAEDAMRVTQLSRDSASMQALERTAAAKVLICNAFGVPPMLLDPASVSRANVEAGIYLHARQAILPRVIRRDQLLNHALVPRFDTRLIIVSNNPVPADEERDGRIRKQYVDAGILTVNEVRAEMGLAPVEWGDKPPAPKPAAPVAGTPGQAPANQPIPADGTTDDNTAARSR